MSSSVQAEQGGWVERLQPRHGVRAAHNLFSPRFLGMLRELLRFNCCTTALARSGSEAQLAQPIGDFLDASASPTPSGAGTSCR